MLPSRRLFLSVLCLATLASACVKPAPPKVSIESLQSDILFAAPSEPVVDETLGVVPPDLVALAPPEFAPFPFAAPRVLPPSTPQGPCPIAPITAFPEESAATNVEQPPKEGGYRWQHSGSLYASGETVAFYGLERNLVRRVTEAFDPSSSVPSATPSRTFTYQTVRPLGRFKLVSDFQVRTNGLGSDPERGLALKKLQLEDASGGVVFSFSPTVGLLYLPLPVAPGSSFSSEALDPASAQRWSLSATIKSRQRVDACGDVVEGWLVEAELAFSGARSGTQNFEYVVAPQLGGVLIREKSSGEGRLGGAANAEFTLGQLRPDSLAEGEK